ncbi:MAG: protein kinase [Thermoleophilia bacterium]|nr:protein kinase [Thermoleophilia bacterium]
MIGRSLGPYKIVEQLGKGGMGEVWLAEDSRLDRKVAVKVLPTELAGDTDRRQRFEQEAKAAAALNHPNIAAVHDVGVETGEGATIHYMVQEYLQGETLRETIARGPLPFEKARSLAVEIGEAIRSAHRAGIVHRDLKPDNVFVTRDGHAKVLDFGLAKLTEFALPSGAGPSMSPTMTMAGQILGTAGYMSPEQVRGEEVDERADLFALGCMLYEMITGKQAFGGDNIHDSLSRILSGEPEPSAKLSVSNPQLGWILDKLLAKERERRYQSAADVVVDLQRLDAKSEAGAPPVSATSVPAAEVPARRSVAVIVAAAAALLVGAVATWILKPSADAAPALDVRFDVMLAQGRNFSANYNRVVAISPDSRTVAYMSEGLRLRSLDRTEPRLVSDTAGSARSPAFSYDSRQIAFWDSGHIKRARIEGGTPIIVGALHERPMGMHWAGDDFIYVGRADRGIWRVPSSGGELEQVLELNEGEYAHGPELLPGGEWVIFSLSRGVRAWIEGSIVAQSLKNNERRVLVQRGREARYLRAGYLTYVQDNTLFAAPFDPDTLEVTGGAAAMENDVHTSAEDETGAAGYDVSDDGVLVVAPPAGTGARTSRLTFLDREGNKEPLPFGPRRFGAARLSPDGTKIAAQINDIEGTHIWIISVDRDGAQRLTTSGRNTSPVWSHDGRHVYFASVRDGTNDIWRRPADLSAPAEKVLESVGAELPTSASTDGRWLYYSRMSPSNSDIARVSLVGEPEVQVLLDSPADELDARVSPDGRFFCFQSDETGRWDIHVMEVASTRRWIVSSADGYRPTWTRDGNRIFYMSGSAGAYQVDVRTSLEFSAGEAVLTFDVDANRRGQTMDASRDGERLLVALVEISDDQTETRPRVTVVLNWFDEIEERIQGAGSR